MITKHWLIKNHWLFSFVVSAPVLILFLTEACSPMKSLKSSNTLLSVSDANICSDSYTTNPQLFMKANSEIVESPFEQQKLHLTSHGQNKATLDNLKEKTLIVVIDNECSSATDSLSALVRALHETNERPRQAMAWTVNSDISYAQLEERAEQDPCILGITLPGTIFTSALAAPTTTDTHISKQTHLSFTNFAHAYEYLIKQQTGASFTQVGFIDTGVDCSHEDLNGRLTTGCGFNTILNSTPADNDGHGTHTLGMVVARTNNGIGITGLTGNNVRASAIKVLDVGSGTVQDSYEGIQYAISQGMDVINISLESQSRLALIEQGVHEAVNAGVVVVMSAGNHGKDLGATVEVSPAMVGSDLPGAITVGSLDTATGALSSFSNFGPKVEIAVPGAIDSSLTGISGGLYSLGRNSTYQRLMGTSQAAPIIAAAAANLIQFFKQNGISYRPADIERILLASSDKASIPVQSGRVLNFSKLVRNAYAYAGQDLCK